MAFDFQFSSDSKEDEEALWEEAEKRLSKIGVDKNDVTGASVNIKKEAGSETPHLFTASIVVYFKPTNVIAKKKGDSPLVALKEALDAVERQVRKKRDKKRKK